MKNIKWAGVLNDNDLNVKGNIPVNAHRIIEAETMNQMMIQALPFIVPSTILLFISMFIKTKLANKVVVNPIAIFIGFLIGFLLIIVHEYLHAIVYPKEADIKIGILPKRFAAVVLVSYPVTKIRFIIMSLLPLVLGIVPLIAFWIVSPDLLFLNGLLFGVSAIGLTSPYPDLYNVYNVIRQVPNGAKIQFYEEGTFWF